MSCVKCIGCIGVLASHTIVAFIAVSSTLTRGKTHETVVMFYPSKNNFCQLPTALHWPALTILVLRTAIATLHLSITARGYNWLTLQDPRAPRALFPHEKSWYPIVILYSQFFLSQVVQLSRIALSPVSWHCAVVCGVPPVRLG